ncbi:hypothetical protein NDA13_000237 [Ustilago tritici]|nr:hypothetical protein NDA13_000237 [Ustilago tritici]
MPGAELAAGAVRQRRPLLTAHTQQANWLAPPTTSTNKGGRLRRYASFLSSGCSRRGSELSVKREAASPIAKGEKLKHQRLFLSIRNAFSHYLSSSSAQTMLDIPRRTYSASSYSGYSAVSTAPTALLTSHCPASDSPTFCSPTPPTASPSKSDSEYRWQYHSIPNSTSGGLWLRTVDSMANFILHWQTRFHQHGDMFASCTLPLTSPPSSNTMALNMETAQLRQAIRRLRWLHPTVALRLAKRNVEEGIEPLSTIPDFIASHVDLQVALVYDVVLSEVEVDAWLDDLLILHTQARERDEERQFGEFLQAATKEGVPGRDRLRIHYWPPQSG